MSQEAETEAQMILVAGAVRSTFGLVVLAIQRRRVGAARWGARLSLL
jgi:hypothetical protein